MSTIKKTKTLLQPEWQPGGTIVWNKDGSVTATEKYHIDYSRVFATLPRRFKTGHPTFPQLVCESISATRLPGELAEVQVQYVGFASQPNRDPYTGLPMGESGQQGEQETWVIDTQTVNIDIQNHPNFLSLATDPSWFDGMGQFVGFGKNASADLRGLTQYLSPQTICKHSFCTVNDPTRPTLPMPVTLFGQKGLITGFTSTRTGGLYKIEVTTLLGTMFNETLYGVASSYPY